LVGSVGIVEKKAQMLEWSGTGRHWLGKSGKTIMASVWCGKIVDARLKLEFVAQWQAKA